MGATKQIRTVMLCCSCTLAHSGVVSKLKGSDAGMAEIPVLIPEVIFNVQLVRYPGQSWVQFNGNR